MAIWKAPREGGDVLDCGDGAKRLRRFPSAWGGGIVWMNAGPVFESGRGLRPQPHSKTLARRSESPARSRRRFGVRRWSEADSPLSKHNTLFAEQATALGHRW
jgi:hypothetical protein